MWAESREIPFPPHLTSNTDLTHVHQHHVSPFISCNGKLAQYIGPEKSKSFHDRLPLGYTVKACTPYVAASSANGMSTGLVSAAQDRMWVSGTHWKPVTAINIILNDVKWFDPFSIKSCFPSLHLHKVVALRLSCSYGI